MGLHLTLIIRLSVSEQDNTRVNGECSKPVGTCSGHDSGDGLVQCLREVQEKCGELSRTVGRKVLTTFLLRHERTNIA